MSAIIHHSERRTEDLVSSKLQVIVESTQTNLSIMESIKHKQNKKVMVNACIFLNRKHIRGISYTDPFDFIFFLTSNINNKQFDNIF